MGSPPYHKVFLVQHQVISKWHQPAEDFQEKWLQIMDKSLTYKKLDQLKNQTVEAEFKILKPNNTGFTAISNFLVGQINGHWIAYDNTCDHNGGTLLIDKGNNTATCPIHKWTLLLHEGKYENSCPKKALKVIDDGEHLIIVKKNEAQFPQIDTKDLTETKIEFNFNAHACVSFKAADLSAITDPWLIESCFATGWWHSNPPSEEAVDRLTNSDLIYISHNHPDHLHIPTLEKFVSREKLFLIPNFKTKSVESILRGLGYNNLIVGDFLQEIVIEKGGAIKLIILKSGDDRDDSSLLVYTKNNTALFGVDTNMPNKWVLPHVDVLFTPFAGGASGFPSRIDNFDDGQKLQIISANKSSVLTNHVQKLVASTTPRFVIPYAGYFTEVYRDLDVNKINRKNSPADLISFLSERFAYVEGINPLDTPHFSISGEKFEKFEAFESPLFFLDDEYILQNINQFHEVEFTSSSENLNDIGSQFISSTFEDSLTIVIIPSNDDFSEFGELCLIVNFSKENRGFETKNHYRQTNLEIIKNLRLDSNNNIEILRVRKNSLQGSLEKKLPLEDLSIGFQIRMFRDPNIYNFKFWDHFTNKEFVGYTKLT